MRRRSKKLNSPVANRHSLNRALRRSLQAMFLTQLVITVISMFTASFIVGVAGFWGALIGNLFATMIIVVTAVINRVASRYPDAISTILMGGYLFKVVLTLIGVLACYQMNWLHHRTLYLVVLISFVLTGMVSVKAMNDTNVLVVDPKQPD